MKETLIDVIRTLCGLFEDKAELRGFNDWDKFVGCIVALEHVVQRARGYFECAGGDAHGGTSLGDGGELQLESGPRTGFQQLISLVFAYVEIERQRPPEIEVLNLYNILPIEDAVVS